MTDSNTSAERDFYRIDDEVRLNWTRVDPDVVRTDTDRETELMELNVYLHDLISTAFGDSAVVGEALGLLNRKIELLTNNEDSPLLNLQAVPVNLSGSGMAFAAAEALDPEEYIEITMLLQPANTIVRVQAQIISTTTTAKIKIVCKKSCTSALISCLVRCWPMTNRQSPNESGNVR